MSQLKIACVGDTMCGDSFNLLGYGVASNLDRYGSDFLPSEIVNIFSSHDIVLCNVECVLSDIGRKENSLRTLHMRGRPETAKYLAKWGITVAHVANNHILEQGLEAAVDTVQQLEKAGIRTVGAGKDSRFQSGIEPLSMTLGAQSVSIIGACFHNGKYAFKSNLDEILQTIKAEAAKRNLVIASVHWGDELIDRPSIWQKQLAQQFANAGASMVIGHHPHVVQGIGSSDNALIAYSLGNFIFDSRSEVTDWSIIISIAITDKKVIKWEAIPILQDKDYRPILARGEKKNELEREIMRRCNILNQKHLDTEMYKKEYASELKALEAKSRHKLWLDIAKRFVSYRPIYWPQILWRPIQRRLGIW
jgi:poly-gamma-glutamate capsule biosynthesis protein CapA/YwtB (metallophosphatase superfamily)